MAPLRRGRSHGGGGGGAAECLAPYRKGRRPPRRKQEAAAGTALPDDALAAVFDRLPDGADVVRCAAACRRWARVVARESAALPCALPAALPGLALGFFHQESAPSVTARTAAGGAWRPPRFVPMASAARLRHGALLPMPPGHGGGTGSNRRRLADLFDRSRPVASRNGRVVLELPRQGHAAGLELCVCNPMTGDVAPLPPLSGGDKPGHYACALLAGDDDLDATAPGRPLPPTFFRMAIVYNRHRFTALRTYSSDSGAWSGEAKLSGPRVDSHRLRRLGQAVVLRGVAYWPLRETALAVRLDTPEPTEVTNMPLHGVSDAAQRRRLLGITADGKLCFVRAGKSLEDCLVIVVKAFIESCEEEDMCAGRWEKMKARLIYTQLKIGSLVTVNLRWFCEKSGILLLTLGEFSNDPGTFALNLATEEVQKLVDSPDCSSWTNFVGYEMDRAAYLASIADH
ncbi:hypothetical protein ACP4OV_029374 [Aristida adscensionis]